MPVALVVVIAAVAVVVAAWIVLAFERHRRARRFAKRLAPYERRRMPGEGQIVDPEDHPLH